MDTAAVPQRQRRAALVKLKAPKRSGSAFFMKRRHDNAPGADAVGSANSAALNVGTTLMGGYVESATNTQDASAGDIDQRRTSRQDDASPASAIQKGDKAPILSVRQQHWEKGRDVPKHNENEDREPAPLPAKAANLEEACFLVSSSEDEAEEEARLEQEDVAMLDNITSDVAERKMDEHYDYVKAREKAELERLDWEQLQSLISALSRMSCLSPPPPPPPPPLPVLIYGECACTAYTYIPKTNPAFDLQSTLGWRR